MANMIDNQLEVRGLEKDVEEFVRKTVRGPNVELLDACSGIENPYLSEQHAKKLGFGLFDREDESRHLYYFRTKWQPPIGFIAALSKQYPALEFALHYYDLLGTCLGDFEVKNGVVKIQNNSKLEEWTAYEKREMDGSQN